MYKAIQKIGGYKVGDEVPAEKAEVWLKMYSVAPVEFVEGSANTSEAEVNEPETSQEEPKTDPMLDDYLGRNTNVVVKNIESDDLGKDRLEDLLKLEKSNKNRKPVIHALNKKLRN
ncbi:MAG: hypothetical protein ACTSRU_10595 [Candidatus Hodarchaeales archaeon]